MAPLLLLLTLQTNPLILRAVFSEVLAADEKALGSGAARTLADAANLASVLPGAEAFPLWQRASESTDAAVAARAFAALGEMREEAGDRPGAAD